VTGTFWQATQPISAASLPLPTGAAQDSTLSTLSGKFTDEVAPTSAASESATSRLGTAAILRLLDTAQAAGSQLVAAKGDQTSGLWVNVKAGNVGLNAGTNYVGRVRQTDGTLDLSLLNSAPGSDTGQISVPVRVISSLAAGGSSGPTIFNHTTNATLSATTAAVRYDNLPGNIVYFTFRRAGSATGTGLSLMVNIQDLDPQTGVALGSQSFNSQELAGATNATFIYLARSTSIQVKFVVGGATPSFTQVYLTGEVRAGSAGIEGAVAEGTDLTGPIKPNPILIGGSNGGILKAFATDGQGTMQVVAGTGGLYSHLTDGTLNLSLLNSAPGSDSGQTAVPVRVISQLGAGSGGGTNDAAASAAASESATTRAAVTAVLRLLDTGQAAGSQLVTAKGDQTTGLWVNVKNASLAVTGTVTANQGTAAALASAWPTKVTDGTNTMPTADAVGRALFAKITDGTNTMPTGDAVARAIFHKLTDGTNTATVRAGSSLPAAADTALVVTTRDLVTIQGNQQAATTGSIIASNSTVSMAVNNINVVTVTLSGATFVGVQFVFEGSADGGTTWSLLQGSRTDTGLIETGTSYALSNTNAPRSWDIPIGGLTNVRVRATAWTSGTATITMIGQAFAYDPAPTATTQPRRLTSYSAGYRLGAATAGQVSLTFTFTANTEKQLATIYHLAAATKIVRIRKISVWVSTGALGVFGFEVKRLSATTTPATGNPAITPGAMDSADGAAEATCLALPTTAGALSATDAAITPHFEWNSAAVAAPGNPSGLAAQELVLYDYRQCDERKPLTMRAGVAEGFAVIGRCTTAVALRFTVHIEFTEEAL
jgi:hypothetical protein